MNPIPSLNFVALMGASVEGAALPSDVSVGGRSAFDMILSGISEGLIPSSTRVPVEPAPEPVEIAVGSLVADGSMLRAVTQNATPEVTTEPQGIGPSIPIKMYHAEIITESTEGSESAIPVIVLVATHVVDEQGGANALMIPRHGHEGQVARLLGSGDEIVAVHMLDEMVTDRDIQAMISTYMPREYGTIHNFADTETDSGTAIEIINQSPEPPADEGQVWIPSRNIVMTTTEIIPVRLAVSVETGTTMPEIIPITTDAINTGALNSLTSEENKSNTQLRISLSTPVSVQTASITGEAEVNSEHDPVLSLPEYSSEYNTFTVSHNQIGTEATSSDGDTLRMFTYLRSDGTVEIVIDRQPDTVHVDTSQTVTGIEPDYAGTSVSVSTNQSTIMEAIEPVHDASDSSINTVIALENIPYSETAVPSTGSTPSEQVDTQDTISPTSQMTDSLHDNAAGFTKQPLEQGAAIEAETNTRQTAPVIVAGETSFRSYEGDETNTDRKVPVTERSPLMTDQQAADVSRSLRGGDVDVQSNDVTTEMDVHNVTADTQNSRTSATRQAGRTDMSQVTDQPMSVEAGQDRNIRYEDHGTSQVRYDRASSGSAETVSAPGDHSYSGPTAIESHESIAQPSGTSAQPIPEPGFVLLTDKPQADVVTQPADELPEIRVSIPSIPNRAPVSASVSAKPLAQQKVSAPETAHINTPLPSPDTTQTGETISPPDALVEAVPTTAIITESTAEMVMVDTGFSTGYTQQEESGDTLLSSVIIPDDDSAAQPATKQNDTEPVRLSRPVLHVLDTETLDRGQTGSDVTEINPDDNRVISQSTEMVSTGRDHTTMQYTDAADKVIPEAVTVQTTSADSQLNPRKSIKEQRITHTRGAAPSAHTHQQQESAPSVMNQAPSSDTMTQQIPVTDGNATTGSGHNMLFETFENADIGVGGAILSDQSSQTIAIGAEQTESREIFTIKGISESVSDRAPADPEKVTQAIIRHARIMIRQGESSARIQLEPPHLGKLQLEITTEQSKVTGRITVESAEVRDIVQNNLPQLRESLVQSGLKVESFDVQVGHNGGSDSWARMVTARQQARYRTQNRQAHTAASTLEEPVISASINTRRGSPGYSTTFDRWI